MAQRWVTEEELMQMENRFEQGGTPKQNPLQQFFEQLPPELQEKIQMLPPEKQQEVLIQLMQKAQQQQPAEQQQFVIGGKIDNYRAVQDFLANSMYSPDGKFFSNRQQYLDYQNLYYPQPLEDNLNQSITNNYFIKKYKPRIKNSFEEGGETQGIPVEAERNETLTTQDGSIPNTEGGYLERKSFNPISGQATYEIPDNEHNQTHPEGGVNMVLKEGDVVNSDKTKIPTDFKVYGKNFKGKTFKEASDFLSKKEEGIQKQLTELQKEGKADRVSENSVSIMLAKAAINRNELNELQEQVLESKKQKEHNQSLEGNIKQFGGLIKNATKAEEVYNKTLDRFLNGYTTERPVLKAEKGLSASISKMQSFTDKIAANPNMSTQDVMAAFKQSGLYNQPSESTAIYKPNFAPIKNGSSVVGNFKEMIASKESNAYKNPYIAMSGIDEATASKLTYNELRPKAASSAIGKYQIVWDLHKNDIKKVTGVSDPEVFRRNPKAQESFMDWFRDNRLLPQATQVKQKYQVPMSIEQIMAGIHLEGMGSEKKKNGFIGKYLSGQLNTSTMAGNFKNASTSNYMQGFEQGGEVEKVSNISYESPYQSYSDPHPKALESFKKDYYDSLEGESSIYVDGKYYVYDGANPIKIKTGKINTPLNKEDVEYKKALELLDNEATLDAKNTYFGNIFSKMGEVPSGYKVPEDYKDFLSKLRQESKGNVNYYDDTDAYSRYVNPLDKDPKAEDVNKYINKFGGYKPSSVRDFLFENRNNFKHGGYIADGGFNFTTWQGDKVIPGLNKADYTADDLGYIAKTYFPNQQFKSNKELQEAIVSYLDENFGGYQNYVKPITPFADKKTPLPGALYDDKFGDDWSAAIKLLKENSPVSVPVPEFKFDPYITREVDGTPIDNRNDLNKNKLRVPPTEDEEVSRAKGKPSSSPKGADILKRMGYGLRESLPYLDNLRLMREGRIMPTLQQRPYDNPYDNMRTDYNIQSNLNENQRALLTTIADSTGNPSVRNARLAQLAANAANMNNQLYSQKYNQELAMENQKTLGQGNYRNQFNLDNMNLQKRYEQEVLQTIENQRQQKHMASNKMMNDYLRKQEQNQATELALLETNYDWNPYSGKFEFNPEKAERNMAYKKATFSPKIKGSQVIEGEDGKKYEIINVGSGKPIVREIKKYGGKIKRK